MNTFFLASLNESLSGLRQHFIHAPQLRVLKISVQPLQHKYRQNTLQSLTLRKSIIEGLLQAVLPRTHLDFIVLIWNDSDLITSQQMYENHLNILRIARSMSTPVPAEHYNQFRSFAGNLLRAMFNNLERFLNDRGIDLVLSWIDGNIEHNVQQLRSKLENIDPNNTTLDLYLNFLTALYSIVENIEWRPVISPNTIESLSCAYYFVYILSDNKRSLHRLHEITLTNILNLQQEQNRARNQQENVPNLQQNNHIPIADREIHIHNNINPSPVYVYVNGQLHDLPENDYRLPWGSPEHATPNPFKTLAYFNTPLHRALYMFGTNYTKLGDTKGQILTNSLQKALRQILNEEVHLIMTRLSLRWILHIQNDPDLNIVPNANDIVAFLRSIQTTHLTRYNQVLDWILEYGRRSDDLLIHWGAAPPPPCCFFDTVFHGPNGPDFERDDEVQMQAHPDVQPGAIEAPLHVIEAPANIQPQAPIEPLPPVEQVLRPVQLRTPQQDRDRIAAVAEGRHIAPPNVQPQARLEAPRPVQLRTPHQDRDRIAAVAAGRSNAPPNVQPQPQARVEAPQPVTGAPPNIPQRDENNIAEYRRNIKNQLQEQQRTLQDKQPEIASFVSDNMRRDLFSVFDFLKRI